MLSLFSGRLGRVRYIVHRSAVLVVFALVFIGLSLLTGQLPVGWSMFMGFLIVLAVLSALVFYTLPAVRRAHDFNASGWLALLSLVPLVNLLFWFIPGSIGANRHGEAPPDNSRSWIVAAVLLPLLTLLLFLFLVFMGALSYKLMLADREATSEQPAPAPDPDP